LTSPAQFQADQIGEIKDKWLTLNEHQRSALVLICRHIGKLGPVACEVLHESAGRLAEGVQYGDFTDDRSFIREGLFEAVDMAHYLTIALKRLDLATKKAAE
jgi:hypothetical protein